MIEITFHDINSAQHVLSFPEDLSELKLSNKIGFDVYHEDLCLWLKENFEDDTVTENRSYYLYLVVKALSEFFDYPLVEVLKFDIAKLTDGKGQLLPLVLDKHFKAIVEGQPVLSENDLKEVEPTILNIYEKALELVKSYKYEALEKPFKYKGETWQIPQVLATLFNGKKVYSKVSVAQGVEMLQTKRFLKEFKNDDLNKTKNARFTSYLRMFALLVRKVGEEFPIDEIPFERKIAERMPIFQDISTKLANDVCFFLISSTKIYQQTNKTTTSLT